MNRSIENMTNMSYILFALSGMFSVAAVIVFFALDIPKCWRMVRGRYILHGKKKPRTANAPGAVKAVLIPPPGEKTDQLRRETGPEETLLLDCETRTVLLDGAKERETEALLQGAGSNFHS